jgi:hypothetical protein
VPPAKTPWKPPFWLIGLDMAAVALLFLGLSMRYAPGGSLTRSLPPTMELPFLIVGGALLALGSVVAVRMVLGHRRR